MGWPGIVVLGAVIGLAGWWLHPLRRVSRTRSWVALLAGVLGAAFARLAGNVVGLFHDGDMYGCCADCRCRDGRLVLPSMNICR
jgi:hypothetical protein